MLKTSKLLFWGLLILSIGSIVASVVYGFPFFFFFLPPLFLGGNPFKNSKPQSEQEQWRSQSYLSKGYCENCGNKLNPQWNFCPNCSNPVRREH